MCVSETKTMDGSADEGGRTAPPAAPSVTSHASVGNHTNGTNKIFGRNVNGTVVVTSAPSNEAELQLYRVMQRASLLAYYDTLLEMGGDDVQQLCDAGEEEFLEIMALVGMASKPLHVRRLQKALQEWVTNPALFQIPIVSSLCPTENPFIPCNQRSLTMTSIHQNLQQRPVASPETNRPMYSPSPGAPENSCGSNSSFTNPSSPLAHVNQTNSITSTPNITTKTTSIPSTTSSTPSLTTSLVSNSSSLNQATVTSTRSYSPQLPSCPAGSTGSSPSSVTSPLQLTPSLLEVQIQRLAAAAERLSKHLPQLEPKPQNTKKKMCKELELVMMMAETDPRRMEEIRKYAAIYGRFDCKRKPEKPLTLHEVSVNEAAAQICRYIPALLTRRDELFPLARQVVRHSGFHYSKGQSQISSVCSSRATSSSERELGDNADVDEPPVKRGRPRLASPGPRPGPDPGPGPSSGSGPGPDMDDTNGSNVPGSRVSPDGQSKFSHCYSARGSSPGASAVSWWTRSSSSRPHELAPHDSDGDSRCSYSNDSSPNEQEIEEHRPHQFESTISEVRRTSARCRDARVQVIATSGDHIIAVANPALALSNAILTRDGVKRECVSPIDNH